MFLTHLSISLHKNKNKNQPYLPTSTSRFTPLPPTSIALLDPSIPEKTLRAIKNGDADKGVEFDDQLEDAGKDGLGKGRVELGE